MANDDIVGKWVLQTSNLKGLWFDFKADGTYYSELPRSSPVIASGTYQIKDGYMIDVMQTEHGMGIKGRFSGRYEVDGDTLKLVFNPVPGGARPVDLKKAGIYKREKFSG